MLVFFFFKQKTAYEIVDCDWSSDVCSSDLLGLYIFRDSEKTGVFIILISSIWPTLINTAFGVANVGKEIGRASCRERV